METQFLNCSMINIINKYMEENYKLKSEIDKLIKENKKKKKIKKRIREKMIISLKHEKQKKYTI